MFGQLVSPSAKSVFFNLDEGPSSSKIITNIKDPRSVRDSH